MLSFLAEAADERPLLVIVEDTHLADQESRAALLFAGHRLGNEGVVLIFATRGRDWLEHVRFEPTLSSRA